ncbi:MAG: hypothetical protein LKI88_01755 [Bifidobacterium sp.]|jgi:predicted ferric reductase|nr:hypothetical protein [Bifidobacterium sp.]MCI1864649.1 hypothetical protein [Bifidobacterium sp.]
MKSVSPRVIITWMTMLFVVPLPMLLTLVMTLPSIYLVNATAIELGVIAYSWMLAAVYLGTRPRWLDRGVGLPHLYVIHGTIGLLAIILAFAHKQLSHSTGLIKLTGDWSFIILLGLACWSMIFMAGWLTSRVPLLLRIKQGLERFAHHELSVWLHRINLVAVALVFIHVQLISYIASQKLFMAVFDTLTVAVFALYAFAKFGGHAATLKGRVLSNRPIAPRVHELSVRIEGNPDFTWEAGDFAFIRFPGVPGLGEYHPFSMVNAPEPSRPVEASAGRHAGPHSGKTLVFAIREDGDFTRKISLIPPSTPVDVLPPYGRYQRFIEEHAAGTPIVMIAGGIGVTPLLAVFERYTARIEAFIYTARQGQLLPYASYLRTESERHGIHTMITHHRVDPNRVAGQILGKNAIYLVAGPTPLQRTWLKFLHAHGVNAEDIYCEPFSW